MGSYRPSVKHRKPACDETSPDVPCTMTMGLLWIPVKIHLRTDYDMFKSLRVFLKNYYSLLLERKH